MCWMITELPELAALQPESSELWRKRAAVARAETNRQGYALLIAPWRFPETGALPEGGLKRAGAFHARPPQTWLGGAPRLNPGPV